MVFMPENTLRFLQKEKLAYLDVGSGAQTLISLHGHMGRARYFSSLFESLKDSYRIISLEQRGHGWSFQADDYSRKAYVDDIKLLVDELQLDKVIILGFSLGGVNAYQFAARYPEHVSGLIVDDIGAVAEDDLSFLMDWPKRFATLQDVRRFFGGTGFGDGSYFMESICEYEDGWGFRFGSETMTRSQQALNGDWWQDWLSSSCPALLMQGEDSPVLSKEHALEMIQRRPNTLLKTFPNCGHGIITANPQAYIETIQAFLKSLK
jgi:esterase